MKLRNLIIGLLALALFGGVFFVYFRTMNTADTSQRVATRPPIPSNPESGGGSPIVVPNVGQVPGGKAIEMRFYNEVSGQEDGKIVCETWTPNQEKREVTVTQPELTLLMPGGMIAMISAREGVLAVDRVDKKNVQPKVGSLNGECRIVIDRATKRDRTPLAERPHDKITITLDQMDFDLEQGHMHTAGPLRLEAADFEMNGRGLDLVWNAADNRIQSLKLSEGGKLVLHRGLLSEVAGIAGEPKPTTAPAEVATTAKPAPAAGKKKGPRPGYHCELVGLVSAEQYRDDEMVATLDADKLDLLFDFGGELGDRPTATQPATTEPGRDRLVIDWDGPLTISPEPPAGKEGVKRRRLEASGDEVLLTQGDARARCSKLAVYDETGQIWLYPASSGAVEFSLADGTEARAETVYIDQKKNIVKLSGNVRLAQPARLGETRGASLRCNLWAELHMERSDSPEEGTPLGGTGDLLQAGRIRSAVFVGSAKIRSAEQSLSAERVEIEFKPGDGHAGLESLLQTAVATGDVHLTARGDELASGRLRVAFATDANGRSFPAELDAGGAVALRSGRATIHGDRMTAVLAPPPEPSENAAAENGRRAEFILQTLSIGGRAELLDPQREIAARGEKIDATFAANALETATIAGTPDELAYLHSPPYTLRGVQIDVNRPLQTLHVDGESKLTFTSTRTLQGQRGDREIPVSVTAHRRLHVDGRANRAEFDGDVFARSGDEHLEADQLTLFFDDRRQPAIATMSTGQAAATLLGIPQVSQLSTLASGAEPAPVRDKIAPQDPVDHLVKEPTRVLAVNVLVESESFGPGDHTHPVMQYALTAPQMDIDLNARLIRTPADTTLMMTNRRMPVEGERTRDSEAIPSALMTRGPSQTVMQCNGPMVYAYGPDGPQRTDRASFEDGVRFRHLAGRDMVNIEQMIPDLKSNPAIAEKLKSRNTSLHSDRLECEFAVPTAQKGQALGAPLQLAMMIATGKVDLRDEQNGGIRSVWCERLEFDRQHSIVRVRGSPAAEARVYYENPQTGEFAVPAVGPAFEIDLESNTVRSGKVSGDIRR